MGKGLERLGLSLGGGSALAFFSVSHALAQSNDDAGSGAFLVLFLLVCLVLFMMPTIVAFNRRHPNRWPIAVINVLFGGTGLGWLGSLIWAFNAVHKSPTGSDGGESGLNLFANDPKTVVLANETRSRANADELIDQLQKLKHLHEQGVVSDDELERLKRPIVDAMLKGNGS